MRYGGFAYETNQTKVNQFCNLNGSVIRLPGLLIYLIINFLKLGDMRLTQPLLDECLVYKNALKEYSINIDHLGLVDSNISITDDVYSCINLQSNILTELIVPTFSRLTTLLLNNNKLSKILIKAPNLRIISLNGNLFRDINDVNIQSKYLENLTLHDTPLETIHHYRLLVIRKFPSLQVLDYQRIKLIERNSNVEIDTNIAEQEPVEDFELIKLKQQLTNATTLEEIQQIEQLILIHKSK